MGKKKKHFVPPEEIDQQVELIIDTTYIGQKYNLVSYKEESLNEALRILRRYGKRIALQDAIQEELHERMLCKTQPGRKPKETIIWFAPRWEAVRALYGKGTASLNDWETHEYLNSIDESWIKNCKGSM